MNECLRESFQRVFVLFFLLYFLGRVGGPVLVVPKVSFSSFSSPGGLFPRKKREQPAGPQNESGLLRPGATNVSDADSRGRKESCS